MNRIKNIVLIGTGNLGLSLCTYLTEKKFNIVGVYSRTLEKAAKFANRFKIPQLQGINDIPLNTDLIILTISDSAISEVVTYLPSTVPVVHTAGSVPLNIFPERINHYGVMYPLQTFSSQKVISLKNVPIFIEANHPAFLENLKLFVSCLTDTMYRLSSDDRLNLHVAAIFANNFTNHMMSIASKLMAKSDLNFELLYPIIEETFVKAKTLSPIKAQTGPAKRNDIGTLKKHLVTLQHNPDLAKLYQLLSESIQNFDF